MHKSYKKIPKFILSCVLGTSILLNTTHIAHAIEGKDAPQLKDQTFTESQDKNFDIYSSYPEDTVTSEPLETPEKKQVQSIVKEEKPALRKTTIENTDSIQLQGNVSISEEDQLITLSLRDSDVRQVLRMLADKAKLNIILDESVSGNVTLDLVNVTLNKAFEYVTSISKLSYWIDDETLIIASKSAAPELALSKQEIKSIDIKYTSAGKIANFLNKNIFSLGNPAINTEEIAVTNPRKNQIIIIGTEKDFELAKKVIAKLDTKREVNTFNVNHTTAGKMAGLVCKNVFGTDDIMDGDDPDGTGGGKLACSTGDLSDNEVSGGSFESFKDDGFSVMYYPDLGKITILGATKDQITLTSKFIEEHDIKQPQVYIEMSIIELNETGSKELTSAWGYYNGSLALDGGYMGSASGDWSGSSGTFGNIPVKFFDVIYEWDDEKKKMLPKMEEVEGYLPGGYNYKGNGEPYALKPNGTITHFVDSSGNVHERVFNGFKQNILHHLQFLISQSKGRVLANPRIIAKNNIESSINITSDYVSGITSTVRDTDTSDPVVAVEYEIGQTGIEITLTPTITPEGYVYLDMTPSYTVPGGKVATLGGSIGLTSTRDLTIEDVRIKDGETLILGGMIQELENKTVKKIPLLGDLPVIGSAFRSTSRTREKKELVITVTPRIVNDDEPQDNI